MMWEVAKSFYKTVFDWKLNDLPGMDSTASMSERRCGRMGPKQMPDQPSAWTAYAEVSDVRRATCAQRPTVRGEVFKG